MLLSQSLAAQLLRMVLLLAVTLMFVHTVPGLIPLLAGQAVDAGCHQSASVKPVSTQPSHSDHHPHH